MGIQPPLRRERPRRLALAIVLLALLAAASFYWWPRGNSLSTPSAPLEDRDARFRRLVVGTWEDDYQGKRTMTLRDDGTGTLDVELSGLRAALAAPRLRFDMTWEIDRGRLKKQTVGGEPAAKVQLILKTMGDRVDEPILELSEERLHLLDQDGKTRYEWRRKAAAP